MSGYVKEASRMGGSHSCFKKAGSRRIVLCTMKSLCSDISMMMMMRTCASVQSWERDDRTDELKLSPGIVVKPVLLG